MVSSSEEADDGGLSSPSDLGAFLQRHRRIARLTQEALADRSGVSVRTIRNLEGGRIRRPRYSSISMLADALGLSRTDRADLDAAYDRSFVPDEAGLRPNQLPPDIGDFTGRTEELSLARSVLLDDRAGGLVAISGPAGAGKTALAVHAAHLTRAEFTDGVLFADLRGTGPDPADPARIQARFITALGGDASAITDDAEERTAQYRRLLADRRVLIVLDDAAGERRLRPLLPGTPSCRVLITSRARPTALEGARGIDLDMFGHESALRLFAEVAGWERAAAEPTAAIRVVQMCGHLPLAVRIAAARLAARPHWSIELLAARLADEHRRLDELAVGDLDVRGSVDRGYRGLDEPQRTLFHRLGLLPGPDFPAWVAMPLLGVAAARADAAVEGLVEARLVDAAGVDGTGEFRYRLHDLLRIFAVERAHAEDSPAALRAALTRLRDVRPSKAKADVLRVPGLAV